MTSSPPGISTSPEVEIESISRHGVWIWVKGQEFLLTFRDHPWFLTATIGQIQNIELRHDYCLHWPDLDVDIDIDSLIHPDRFPLTYRP
jgi:hypothetical protein